MITIDIGPQLVVALQWMTAIVCIAYFMGKLFK